MPNSLNFGVPNLKSKRFEPMFQVLWYLGVAVIGVSARLVSVADLHGDFDHAVNILVSAKLIDKVEHVGGRSQMDVDGG